ncbi:MAG: Bax inhibitor-1/YccA family protein [Ilumatobacteraceae bacterium]
MGATVAVFLVMLVLYRTNIIKVTNRFRKIVITATIGVMLFYGVTFIISLFAGADSISSQQPEPARYRLQRVRRRSRR